MTLEETALSTLISGTHGRERRVERGIEKIDLQRARRYGMEEEGRRGRIKYTHGGIVFIYDPLTNREVTSFKSRDFSAENSGTKFTTPVILPKMTHFDDPFFVQRHSDQREQMMGRMEEWTSHSVLVIDMSGSMRRDDVNGARCRSDGVWMTLARDYVKKPLEKKSRSHSDLVSVVVMQEEAKLIFACEPTDWVLYNKLIDLREWKSVRPEGHGNYMPALELAEKLLMLNPSGKNSLSLLFFSDGKPTDKGEDFTKKVGEIASKIGRRLNFTCIGMADEGEDFSTLIDMVSEAKSYGAIADFGKPSLDADSLSGIISTLASSLTTSKTEMSDLKTGKIRPVRMDLKREKVGTPDDVAITEDWKVYRHNSNLNYVARIWSWDCELNEFVRIFDPRCNLCFGDTRELHSSDYWTCPSCKICYFCKNCFNDGILTHTREKCSTNIHDTIAGKIVHKKVPSFSVAWKKTVFGEGAERIVHKFRFLDNNDNFKGPVMVAKDSRFVEQKEKVNYTQKMHYHEQFMRTQKVAAEYAKKFNEALDGLVQHFHYDSGDRLAQLPRINFLEPLVVEVSEGGIEKNILIEQMLDGKFEKFNNNKGYVMGQQQAKKEEDLCDKFKKFDLGAILEEDEEEEDEDENGGMFDGDSNEPARLKYSDLDDLYFPQAFSHFTYEKSKKRFMVVDLQGIFKSVLIKHVVLN